MKAALFGIAAFFFSLFIWLFCHDYNLNHLYYVQLRNTAEEASVAATMFISPQEESEGRIVFNQAEGHKAIRAVLKSMLKTDESLNPSEGSYWQQQIIYSAYFYDDSNTTYPYTFADPQTGYTTIIYRPSVIVTINAGKARYSMKGIVDENLPNIRSAAHEIEGR